MLFCMQSRSHINIYDGATTNCQCVPYQGADALCCPAHGRKGGVAVMAALQRRGEVGRCSMFFLMFSSLATKNGGVYLRLN